MGNIVLLDELTINKIAAGEVIERPASVVKELMENSIDAGATNISVEIKNGGISYIRITDNGKGIMPDDMEMAVERHATSKIRKADDLETVTSMGFRGEALASIAAISHMEILSKAVDNEIGCKVEVKGGQIINREDAGCPKGTTMTITDLFYNTPVRYKFLKKDFTEAGYIEDVVTRIALIHPEVAIKLVNSGKTVIQTSGNGDIKSVIYNVYGKDIAENIIEVDYEYEDIKVKGVIGKPIIARSNRSNQLFFVNSRYIKDRTLTSAAEQGYKGMITIGKYAFLILNLEMDPKKVDVNVHPAKLEVRFEEESKVFKAVYHSIKESLLKGDLVPDRDEIKFGEKQEENANIEQKDDIENKQEKDIKEDIKQKDEKKESFIAQTYTYKYDEENNDVPKIEHTIKAENIKENDINKTNEIKIPTSEIADNKDKDKALGIEEVSEKMKELSNLQLDSDYGNFDEMYAKTFGITKKEPKNEDKIEEESEQYKLEQADLKTVENVSIFEKARKLELPTYKFIGIAFSTYIIIEMDRELYIIDQHAAHERIMYEKVKKNYYSETEKDSQMMLLPDIITLTHRDMEIAKDNMDIFRKAGFVLEEFGENTIKLSGAPNICIDLDTKELFMETLDEINTVARTAKQEIEEKFIATVACKAAVKANMALSKEEVDNLMTELLKLPNPFTCPHGRPTAIKMTKNDIEKKFSRR